MGTDIDFVSLHVNSLKVIYSGLNGLIHGGRVLIDTQIVENKTVQSYRQMQIMWDYYAVTFWYHPF